MDLEAEVRQLTRRVAALEAAATVAQPAAPPSPVFQPAVPAAPAFGTASATQPPPPGFPLASPREYGQAEAAEQPAAFEWGIETLLRWTGVALVTLAGVFLVSTAISRGWIGPELQLLSAAIGGAAMLGAAVRLAKSRPPWALPLGSGGAVVLATSALATHEWLDVVGPGVALVLLALATAVSIVVSLQLRLEGIALVAAVVGMLVALGTLDNFGDGAVLTWIAAFIVGSTALGLTRTWPALRIITGWLGAAMLMTYAVNEDVDGVLRTAGFVGAAIIGATLWAGPTVAHRLMPINNSDSGPVPRESFDWRPLDYRLVGLVPAWAWAATAGLLSPLEGNRIGLVAMITASTFAGLVALTWQYVPRLISITTIFGSLGLLALGFAIYLDGPALMVALIGQAVTSYYLSRRLSDDLLRYGSYLVGLASSALATYEMFDALNRDGFPNVGHGLATLLVVLCWVTAAAFTYGRDEFYSPFQLLVVGAWAGIMLWLASALIGAPQGLMLISAAWTLLACTGLVLGLTERVSTVRNVALGTLGITLFKLVSVDMSEVDVFWRVGLFFVVGMGLIALGLKVPSLIGRADEEPHAELTATGPTTF